MIPKRSARGLEERDKNYSKNRKILGERTRNMREIPAPECIDESRAANNGRAGTPTYFRGISKALATLFPTNYTKSPDRQPPTVFSLRGPRRTVNRGHAGCGEGAQSGCLHQQIPTSRSPRFQWGRLRAAVSAGRLRIA